MRFLRWILLVLTVYISLISVCYGFDRVVLLSPASADIFLKLGLDKKVVGITKHIKGFKNAVKVGSHLHPNIELILSLKPDLIVYENNKFIKDYVESFKGIKTYRYDPRTIDGVLKDIEEIASMMGVKDKGKKLVNQLKEKLKGLKKLRKHPRVIYEITQMPYIVAGKKNIVSDIIEKAGGINLITVNKKLVRFSYELAASLKPDIYIYQVGPMNRNPTPPKSRPAFKDLNAYFIKVNELDFSRANIKSIDDVIFLNKLFYKWSLK